MNVNSVKMFAFSVVKFGKNLSNNNSNVKRND